MNPTTNDYLGRLARSALIIGPFIGLMDLIQDYRRSNYRDAIVVCLSLLCRLPSFFDLVDSEAWKIAGFTSRP